MAKIKILVTLILLFLLIYFRIQVRILNDFSADELKEIGSLQSVHYLITGFLPTIPGGAPGDYLVVLPFNKLFPANHYMLAIPGLLSHLLVFIFLPKVIAKLNIVRKEDNFLVSTAARIFFVFDPTLTFQATEIRPYANLPFYWIANVFIVSYLVKLVDNNSRPSAKSLTLFLLFVFLLTALFIWHFYMIIMFLSIYLFLIFETKKEFIVKLFSRKSFYAISASIIVAFPFWKYFSSQTGVFPYNTFEWLGMTVAQIYAIDKGGQRGLTWQNWMYFLLLLCMIFLFMTNSVIFFRNSKPNIKSYIDNYFRINIFFVTLPLAVILILDVFTSYMFLYRQFVWIMLPFYIANGIVLSSLYRLKRNGKQYAKNT